MHDMISDYLIRETDIEFDELDVVNNRPTNIWLYALCRNYIDPDEPEDDQIMDADVQMSGPYPENPTDD